MATAHKVYTTPLAKKLGIVSAKSSLREVALLGAPAGLVAQLGELPETVKFTKKLAKGTELALCFTRSADEVRAVVELLAGQLPVGSSAWIVWPKARLKPGYNENDVRDAGLARGLVDYKVCAVDDDWSALKFAWRKAT